MIDQTPSAWLSPSQVAHRLNVTPQWAVRLMDSGRIRHVRTPLGRLADSEDVRRLAEERRLRHARPTPAPGTSDA